MIILIIVGRISFSAKMELKLLLCVIGAVIADSHHYDTIVVGVGAAGATAAAALARAGRRVLALDAAPRVGGRVHTVPFGDGLLELGAEWIVGTELSVIYETAIRHNASLLSQGLDTMWFHSDGSAVDSVVSQLLTDELVLMGDGPDPPEAQGNFTTKKIMEEITKKKPELLKDQDFITDLLWSADLMVSNLEASSTWNDVTTGGDYEDLGGNQEMSWHRLGYKTFIEIMLNTYKDGPGLPGLDVKLNKEVTLITVPQHPGERVTVSCADGSQYEADTAIVTVSLGVLKAKHSTLFSPPLPRDKQTAIEKISMGVLDKMVLSFEDAWWPQNVSRIAFMWKLADRRRVPASDYWTTRVLGAHPPMASSNTLTLWVSGNAAKEMEKLPEHTLKTKCVELLQRFVGDTMRITVPQPSAFIRTTWFSNPFTFGSYTYDNLLAPQNPARAGLAVPLADSSGAPRVLFAGEATNSRHFGTVHGASETGHREAMRLLESSKQ